MAVVHHHPRPRRGRRDGRRDRGDVRRPDRRAGARGHDLRRARAPLHVGPAALDPAPRHAARRGARADPGQAAAASSRCPAAATSTRAAPTCATRHRKIDPELEPVPGSAGHQVACLLEAETRRRLWRELQTGGPAAQAARDGRRGGRGRERAARRGARPRQALPAHARGSCSSARSAPCTRSTASPSTCGRARRWASWARRAAARAPTARLMLRLLEPTGGTISFEGEDITRVRGRAAQGPASRDADDLPGPLLVAEPAQDRRDDHRRAVRDPRPQSGRGRAQARGAGADGARRASTRSTTTATRTSSRAGSASASAWRARSRSSRS